MNGARTGLSFKPAGWRLYAPVWVVFVVLSLVLLASRGVVTTIYTHDLYVVFDGAWRVYLHEWPFVDFHSPVGIAYFLPYVLLREIEPYSLMTLLHANVVVASGLLILATLTLPRRMPPLIFFVSVLAIVTVVISPHAADWPIGTFSHLAPYNRWCEATTMLLAAVVLLAPREAGAADRRGVPARTDLIAAVSIALLALFLFHIKITFFLCAIGLAGVGLLTRQITFRTVAVASALVLAAAAALEITLHLHRPYFEDLDMARRATIEVYRRVHLLNRRSGVALAAAYSVLVVVLLLLCGPREPLLHRLRRWWPVLATAVSGCALAALTNMQNHNQFEIPLMGTILLVAVELIRRETDLAALSGPRRTVLVALVALGAGSGIFVDSGAVVAHTVASRDGSTCPIPGWRGTPGEQLLFDQVALTRSPNSRNVNCASIAVAPFIPAAGDGPVDSPLEALRLSEAETLLHGRLGAHDRVLAVDFSSPYSVFTATRPADGALLWWHLGRNYSQSFHPDGVGLLQSVDFVMESIHELPWEMHGAHMWAVYGPKVTEAFVPVAEGKFWRLWRRRDAPLARGERSDTNATPGHVRADRI